MLKHFARAAKEDKTRVFMSACMRLYAFVRLCVSVSAIYALRICAWSFHSRDRILQMKLFDKFVCSILEYNSSVWSLCLVKNISAIDRAQKFVIKRLKD